MACKLAASLSSSTCQPSSALPAQQAQRQGTDQLQLFSVFRFFQLAVKLTTHDVGVEASESQPSSRPTAARCSRGSSSTSAARCAGLPGGAPRLGIAGSAGFRVWDLGLRV